MDIEGASVAFEQQLSMRKSSARPCFGARPQANDGSSRLHRGETQLDISIDFMRRIAHAAAAETLPRFR
ncbi:MAG: hypothetical protein E5V22_30830, partial [Mesorhizobium sp.]